MVTCSQQVKPRRAMGPGQALTYLTESYRAPPTPFVPQGVPPARECGNPGRPVIPANAGIQAHATEAGADP